METELNRVEIEEERPRREYYREIRFRDLSGWVKVGVIAGWGVALMFIVAFTIGFIQGLMLV